MATQNIQIKPKLNPNSEYTKPIKHWNKNSPQNNHTECTYRVSKQNKTPTQNTNTYHQHLMKFPYRTPRQITTYSKLPHRSPIQNLKPIQRMYNWYVFTKVLEKDIHTYHFYQNLVNTSVVIWNVNLKYKNLVFLPKFVR